MYSKVPILIRQPVDMYVMQLMSDIVHSCLTLITTFKREKKRQFNYKEELVVNQDYVRHLLPATFNDKYAAYETYYAASAFLIFFPNYKKKQQKNSTLCHRLEAGLRLTSMLCE